MAQFIVNRFKIVEVDKNKQEPALLGASLGKQRFKMFKQRAAVGQTGQFIGIECISSAAFALRSC